MSQDVLPDCRPKTRRGSFRGPDGVNYAPVYCANCGAPQGAVPEEHITHVFALCDNGCAGKYGDLAHTYVDPDTIFRMHATEAQLEQFDRLLTPAEVERALSESNTGLLAAAARDWRARAKGT